jgi:CRISPR/Cas system-associated endoribonuclease Cas2
MSDIAYYDIKREMRMNRLSELKQLRNEQIHSLQKSIKERGDDNSEILKDILKKNKDIINKEKDDIHKIISHLNYLITNTKNTNQHLNDMKNEIQILTTRLQ